MLKVKCCPEIYYDQIPIHKLLKVPPYSAKEGANSLSLAPSFYAKSGVIKHSISPSLHNFLDKLDFKFKEDENDADDLNNIDLPNKTSPMLLSSNSDIDKDGDNEYIYNPTAQILMDLDGHLPQLRRSSLSEDEQERMEQQAVLDMQARTSHSRDAGINEKQGKEIINVKKKNNYKSSFNNLIFKDSNVKNMSMSIINHHQHNHTGHIKLGINDRFRI